MDRQRPLLNDDVHYGAALGKHLTDKWSMQIEGYTSDFNGDLPFACYQA